VTSPATSRATARALLPTPRTNLATASVDGLLFAVGGNNGDGPWLSVVESYDPASNLWSAKAPMPTPRTMLGVAATSIYIYAVGGGNSTDARLPTVEKYRP